MTMQLVRRNSRDRVLAAASALLLFILPAFAGIAAAQIRQVGHLTTAHLSLADRMAGIRAADSVQVRVPNGQPVLAFDAADLNFDTTAIGDSSGWRMTMLTNTGPVDATGLEFTMGAQFQFPSVASWEPCYGWSVLPAGAACLIVVKFAPSTSGQVNGTLSVSSAEGAAASLDLAGVGSEASVLYSQFHDWSTQASFLGLINSNFLNVPLRNSELADDFEVAASSSWIVSSVGVEVVSPGRPAPPPVDVYFMPDANGLTGDTPVCAAPASQITLWEPSEAESRAVIELSSPCALAPGHYWLRIVFTVNDVNQSLYWGLQYVQRPAAIPSGDAPPVHLYSPIWRNPGGGVGYQGCSDWTPVVPPNCGLERYSSDIYTFYGSVFWIIGQEIVVDPIFADGFEVL